MRTKFSGILTLLLALVVQISFAQQKTVTGTVTDDTGLPLPGANIIIKGTSTGTQSDFDGNYSLSVSQGQILTFSYIGFDSKEVTVGTSNTINVTLAPGAELDEVVLTGYSRRGQTVQTSAVVSISSEELSQMAPTTSIDNMLQGKAAGVQVTAANGKPGQGAFVRIRGIGSLIAGAASPLYLVDGAPIREEDLSNIPNEDIENISILKDAATTAQYGSRGSNGVVVITTKSGQRNKDATIRFSSRYGVVSRIKPNFELMDATQKMQFEAELYALGVSAAAATPGVTTEPGSPERQFLLDHETDWEDLILKDGILQNNSVSISGGAEKVDYYFSVSNDRNTGIIDQINGFERTGSRLNVNIDAKDWLNVGVNVGYSRSHSDEPRDRFNAQNPFFVMYSAPHYDTEFVLDEDGNRVLDESGNPIYNLGTVDYPIREAAFDEPRNNMYNTTLSSVTAQVLFNDNWSYEFQTSVNWQSRREDYYIKPGSHLAIVGAGLEGGHKRDRQDHRVDFTVSNRLNYNLSNEDHHLNVLGLYEYNMNEYNSIVAVAGNFPSPLLNTLVNAAEVRDAISYRSRLTLASYGAFADYDFRNRYFVSGSIRRDGSSNFGADVKWGTFWSGSLAWNLAEESFFDVDWVNDLKLRGSYGSVGNRAGLTRYQAQGTVTFGSYPGGSATEPNRVANPELSWETTTTTNFGLEFNAFRNRLRLVSDYFIRETSDLLFPIQKTYESGVGRIVTNLGDIENKGLELAIQGDIIQTPDFRWTLGGNIVFLDHKIVKLPDEFEDGLFAPGTSAIEWKEGQKINEHYRIRYAGVDPETGRGLFYGGDGNTYFASDLPEDMEHRVFQGKSTIADKEGGFFTNITYKGFGLRTDFVFKSGNYINNIVRARTTWDGADANYNKSVDAFNYWKAPGDTGVAPSPIYAVSDRDVYYSSDRWLEKGDYIRLRNITLSYTFPSQKLERTPISSLRLYAQGQNLLTFSKFWGDPEVGISSGETTSFANTVAPGETTLYSYPNTSSIQVGLDVSF